jgi:GxxExxY protein
MPEIIHKELSYVVNGCIFDIHNELGPGLREECYQKALEIRLAQAGLTFIGKPYTRDELFYLSELADVFEPDLLISDRLVLEIKVQREGLTTANFRQTVNYVKFWRLSLGLLVDFADAQAVIRRVAFHEVAVEPEEDFEAIRGLVTPQLRPLLVELRDAVMAVHQEFGLGYSDTTYRKLVEIGVRHRGLHCDPCVTVRPTFRGYALPISPITPLLVGKEILLEVGAIREDIPSRAIRAMQTHLQVTGAAFGMLVNFGKNRLQLRGVRPPKSQAR